MKIAKYVLAFLALISVLVAVYTYRNQVLSTLVYVGIVIGIIFLIAGIYKLRSPLGQTLRDFKEASSWASKFLRPIYVVVLVFYAGILFTGIYLMDNSNIKWWIVSITLIVCHIIASIKVIGPRENGVMIFLGRIISSGREYRHFESGAIYAPWPIQIVRLTKNEITTHFGTADEEVKKKANSATSSESWFVDTEPIRISFGLPSDEDKRKYKNDPLAERITVDPHLYVTIQIYDPALWIEAVGYTVEEGLERIIGTTIRALTEIAGRIFVGKAVETTSVINEQLFGIVQGLVGDPDVVGVKARDSWGVDIKEVGVKSWGLPKRVNIALADRANNITVADGEATALSRKAESEKDQLIKIGEGNAEAKKADAVAEAMLILKTGEAENVVLAQRAKIAGTKGGRTIVTADALEAGLKHGKATIIPADFGGGLVSAFLAGKAALDATEEKPKTAPTDSPKK